MVLFRIHRGLLLSSVTLGVFLAKLLHTRDYFIQTTNLVGPWITAVTGDEVGLDILI